MTALLRFFTMIFIAFAAGILCTTSLFAQKIPGLSAVVLTSQTGYYEQEYHIQDEMPRATIKNNWDKGRHITALVQGNTTWATVLSSHTNLGGQSYTVADTLPLRFIEQMWDKNYRITGLDFGNGVWTLVMSQGTEYVQQVVCIDDSLPHQRIKEWRAKGYLLSSLIRGNGVWVTMYYKAGWFLFEQPYIISDTFPYKTVNNYINKGYRIQSLHHYGTWAIVLNSIARSKSQIVLIDSMITKSYMRNLLDSGYRITHIAAEKSESEIQFISSKKPNIQSFQSLDLSENPTPDNIHLFRKYIQRNAPQYNAILALQKLIAPDIHKELWNNAADTCRFYRKYFRDSTEIIDGIITLLTKPEPKIDIFNAGDSINSNANEWDPNPSPDGRYFYTSTSGKQGSFGQEDVFIAEKKSDGTWSKSKNIGTSINTPARQETIDNIATDNNTLYLSGEFSGTFGRFDIFTSERTDKGWSALMQLPKPINSEFHDESGCPTPDGHALLFTSDRPGAIGEFVPKQGYILHGTTWGNSDIYISFKTDSGWTKPLNLGKTINTPYAETSVFLHPDGRTLYFSSNGHGGFGGLDIYKSVRLREDSWTEWSTPINVGRQINTVGDDWGFHASVNTDTIYFAARDRKGGKGGWDIWKAKVFAELLPANVASVRGKVQDEQARPLAARIKWEDLSTGKTIGELSSNPQDGSYYIALPLGKIYGFFAEKEGYYPQAKNIDTRSMQTASDTTFTFTLLSLESIKRGAKSVIIENIFFDFDSYTIQPTSFPELQRLIQLLQKEKELAIEIGGHTDEQGGNSYNLQLSKQRAMAVKEYLIAQGIEKERLTIRGYGKQKPLSTAKNQAKQSINRRVEFTVLKKKGKNR